MGFVKFVTVSFYCYEQTTISLELYDIQGKLVKFVADGITYPEGKNEINIESDSLEKGLYLLKLTINNWDFVYKLIKN
ncbi:MAG: T9SS type A sorting domain-containing protein [Prevotellaceae bacterium]|nr:T9SS type A sorting domain-containing protein [Prevotellaceae bacterium]